MGKRLVRINNNEISGKIQELIGREVNFVLAGKNVIHGTIITANENSFKIKDLLFNTQEIKFSEVNEIVYDKEAAF